MSAAVDMPIQHIDGRRGRLIAVRSVDQSIVPSTTPSAWAILVVVGGRFEEWRAVDCQTAPPVAAPKPPTRAPADPYSACCTIGCKAPTCPNV